ncbi:hypothetical protein [Stenotrophomonas maltophilia]|uniref:hypothetical protein n=1 Tax=Stenotrophomonas maltophilia TaxID=40324 RepID=UPI001310891C
MGTGAMGPSVYYVTDKNIFDALNEHKVTEEIMSELLSYRNTIVSPNEKRLDVSRYFSQLTHDYFDNQRIASVLGVASRRERVTALVVEAAIDEAGLRKAVDSVAENYRKAGDLVAVNKKPSGFNVSLQYSRVDYRRSEFNQVQVRDADLSFSLVEGGVEVRSTQNDYVDKFRDEVVFAMRQSDSGLVRKDITLSGHISASVRSKFFHDLYSDLPGFSFVDVTDMYVYRPSSKEGEAAPEVERVALRGNAVNSTKIFSDLATDGYYVVRVIWTAKEKGNGNALYTIESLFVDPESCSDFSYLAVGVQELTTQLTYKRRRTPTRSEAIAVSIGIEQRARSLMSQLALLKPLAQG